MKTPFECVLHRISLIAVAVFGFGPCLAAAAKSTAVPAAAVRPNILVVIAEDMSWPHAGVYGSHMVQTPNFDALAREGVLFNNAFSMDSSDGPSRVSMLTGRAIWQNQEGGVNAGFILAKYPLVTDLLAESGYHVGYTGRDCGMNCMPLDAKIAIDHDPYGRHYDGADAEARDGESPPTDYGVAFREFLSDRKPGQPFLFHLNAVEPGRPYVQGIGLAKGKKLRDAELPPFLPDYPAVRREVLDYAHEIDYFDEQLGRLVEILRASGELEHTLIIATSDNGMPFLVGKMHCYEFGHHVPLAIRWGRRIPAGRMIDDLVSLDSLAVTICEAAGLPVPSGMTAVSLMPLLQSTKSGQIDPNRTYVFWGKERHNPARESNLGYPIRAVRTKDYLYIWNIEPHRWPAGDPPYLLDWRESVDESNDATATLVLQNTGDPVLAGYLTKHTAKRPAEELYRITEDPGCMRNLAGDRSRAETLTKLRSDLEARLRADGDPRLFGLGDCFDNSASAFEPPRDDDTGMLLFQAFPEKNQPVVGLQYFDHSHDEDEARQLLKPRS